MYDNVFEAAKSIPISLVIEHFSDARPGNGRLGGNICCPFHEDKKPSFHIYERTNSFHCFSCKRSGTAIDFVKFAIGLADSVEAAKEICNAFNISYQETYLPDIAYENYIRVYKWCSDLFVRCNLLSTVDYWKMRGLDTLIQQYGLGYCPDYFTDENNTIVTFKQMLTKQFPDIPLDVLDSYGLYDSYGHCVFAGRYIFSIKDIKGNVVAFSGRDSSPEAQIKYKNTKETNYFHKKDLFYNLDKAKGYPTIFVVEGYADLLSLIASGVPNAVANLGLDFGEGKMSLLNNKNIVFAFDNDDAGHKATADFIESHSSLKNIYVFNNFGKAYKDFNEALVNGVDLKSELYRRGAIIYGVEFLFDYLRRTLGKDKGFTEMANRDKMWQRMSVATRGHSPVVKDNIAIKIQRLFKGKRRNKNV